MIASAVRLVLRSKEK